MSLKDRFANHSENAAEQPQPEEQKSVELYDTPGHARNICFVQADGGMTFLNYAYLVYGSFNPNKSEISLEFTDRFISISGVNLHEVFEDLLTSKVLKIFVSDKRYESALNKKELIFEIKVTLK